MLMDKAELRKEAIHTLKDLSETKKEQIELALTEELLNSPYWRDAQTIGITISQGFEWDTEPIIRAAWESGKNVCAPKCIPKTKALSFYNFTSYEQLEVVYYNLKEPDKTKTKLVKKDDIDLIIVPGVLFDHSGYRIGFGGGYYDRFLEDFNNQTISLVSSIQLVEQLPKESYDIPVKHVITEDGIIDTAN